MIKKVISIIIFCCLFNILSFSQSYTKADIVIYISKYKNAAINKMNEFRIPASITLAQGIFESGAGTSDLATEANNHFGIKCGGNWKGETMLKDDDIKNDCFRKYESVEDCFSDHSKFLTEKERYADLFKLEITDYKGWAKGLKKAGYATNEDYASLLIKIIEDYELNEYDKKYKAVNVSKEDEPSTQITKNDIFNLGENELYPIKKINGRNIYINNQTRFVVVRKGDTFAKIGKDINSEEWLLVKYNDVPKGSKVKEGDIVYIETKRKRGIVSSHLAQEGETVYKIAQFYGIRMKYIKKYNNFDDNTVIKTGSTVWLKKR